MSIENRQVIRPATTRGGQGLEEEEGVVYKSTVMGAALVLGGSLAFTALSVICLRILYQRDRIGKNQPRCESIQSR